MRSLNRAAAVLLTLLVAASLMMGAPAAHAVRSAAASTQAALAITSVSPGVATPGQPVIVAGTVSAGSEPLPDPVVSAAVGSTDLDTTAAVVAWTDANSSPATRDADVTRPGALSAGQSRPFVLTIPENLLALTFSNANLPLQISVSSTPGGPPVATWRTTLSLVRTTPALPLSVTWLVPLTLPADSALFGPSTPARLEAWNRAIGPGSRIDSLLRALAAQPVTWVIDPVVIAPPGAADDNVPAPVTQQPVPPSPEPTSSPTTEKPDTSSTAPSSGSSSGQATSPTPTKSGSQAGSAPPTSQADQLPGATTPGDGAGTTPSNIAGLAATLRARLRDLPTNQSVLWTAHDDPDVSALASSGSRGRKILREEVGRTLPSDMRAVSSIDVAWPAAGVDSGLLRTITGTWSEVGKQPPAVVLPRDAVAGAGSVTTTAERSSAGTAGVLLYDQALSAIAGSAEGDPGLRAQQFLARTLAIYEEQPATSRSLAIAVPRSGAASAGQLAQIISTARKAPWLTDRTGSEAVRIAGSARPTTAASPRVAPTFPAARSTAVTPALLQDVQAQRVQLSGLNSLLVDSLDVILDRLTLINNLGSTRWRGHPSGVANASSYSASSLASILSKVNVVQSSVNFFTNRLELPITVTNRLNRDVHGVQVVFKPRAIILRVRRQPPPIPTIAANGGAIVRPQVVAAGSGTVPVDTVLQTSNRVLLGVPRETPSVQVNVQPTATWIYQVLGGLASLILIGGVIRSIRRGPRSNEPVASSSSPSTATASDEIIADE